ncbi:actin cytoskeleton-regulatory complex protein PAN1 isoform X2 [Thalassophryne amazonica]|uniref:actin cytoskeleton-regulatory complex protein PAN1 isoform X2 n=1 Tax=Thalassophryne amazonica TaxID=390379 RepID=UPI0014716451|nr:actin cytoskeleton-regulatory complex protein PAN1 isoform X2 [Thalassophryne amazonica]
MFSLHYSTCSFTNCPHTTFCTPFFFFLYGCCANSSGFANMIREKLLKLSQRYANEGRMEEPLQKETEAPESQNPNEDEGGIHRRLRDRDLLRKRKAEAEEKETNQVESMRKRSRAVGKSRTRGRPRKAKFVPESSFSQEEPTPFQEAVVVEVLPEPAEVIPAQMSGSAFGSDTLTSQPAPALALDEPVLPSVQSPVLTATLTSQAPPTLAPVPVSALVLVPSPDKAVDTIPTPSQESITAPALDTVPVQTLSQPLVPEEHPDPSSVPSSDETTYKELQSRKLLDQVLIEDLGSDEQEDICSSQDKGADEDLSEKPQIDVPEQNKMFSLPTLSSLAPQHEYLPGNGF